MLPSRDPSALCLLHTSTSRTRNTRPSRLLLVCHHPLPRPNTPTRHNHLISLRRPIRRSSLRPPATTAKRRRLLSPRLLSTTSMREYQTATARRTSSRPTCRATSRHRVSDANIPRTPTCRRIPSTSASGRAQTRSEPTTCVYPIIIATQYIPCNKQATSSIPPYKVVHTDDTRHPNPAFLVYSKSSNLASHQSFGLNVASIFFKPLLHSLYIHSHIATDQLNGGMQHSAIIHTASMPRDAALCHLCHQVRSLRC